MFRNSITQRTQSRNLAVTRGLTCPETGAPLWPHCKWPTNGWGGSEMRSRLVGKHKGKGLFVWHNKQITPRRAKFCWAPCFPHGRLPAPLLAKWHNGGVQKPPNWAKWPWRLMGRTKWAWNGKGERMGIWSDFDQSSQNPFFVWADNGHTNLKCFSFVFSQEEIKFCIFFLRNLK